MLIMDMPLDLLYPVRREQGTWGAEFKSDLNQTITNMKAYMCDIEYIVAFWQIA